MKAHIFIVEELDMNNPDDGWKPLPMYSSTDREKAKELKEDRIGGEERWYSRRRHRISRYNRVGK
jgi:hypothetical protein